MTIATNQTLHLFDKYCDFLREFQKNECGNACDGCPFNMIVEIIHDDIIIRLCDILHRYSVKTE